MYWPFQKRFCSARGNLDPSTSPQTLPPPEGFTKAELEIGMFRHVFAMFCKPSVSLLNTSGNLHGTLGQIGIEKKLFKILDALSLIRDVFWIFCKPSETIHDVREPIDINSASSESLLLDFVIILPPPSCPWRKLNRYWNLPEDDEWKSFVSCIHAEAMQIL